MFILALRRYYFVTSKGTNNLDTLITKNCLILLFNDIEINGGQQMLVKF